jgi:hypothetical protein
MSNEQTGSALMSSGCLTIEGFCRWSGLGRTKVYDLIARGDLRPRKCGRRTLISAEEATRWRNSLPHLLPVARPTRDRNTYDSQSIRENG